MRFKILEVTLLEVTIKQSEQSADRMMPRLLLCLVSFSSIFVSFLFFVALFHVLYIPSPGSECPLGLST